MLFPLSRAASPTLGGRRVRVPPLPVGGNYVVGTAVAGDFLYEIGLRNRDEVLSINGLPLEDWQDAADAFGELWLDQGETVYEIEVDRWQVGTITLDVEIQDPTFAP